MSELMNELLEVSKAAVLQDIAVLDDISDAILQLHFCICRI